MTLTTKTPTARSRRFLPAVLAVAALAVLTACGGSSSSASGAGSSSAKEATAHNTADVRFATDMIPHHAQAVEMATMALSTSTDAEIKSLAQAIQGAQDPEIKTMTGWLTSWQVPVPATGMQMSAGNSMGMMSADEMAALGKASGPAFDRLWVQMMTQHHKGAVEMANAELKDGQFADAKALARQIVTAQTAEIAKMGTIAQRLG